jgi:hypothetical protein
MDKPLIKNEMAWVAVAVAATAVSVPMWAIQMERNRDNLSRANSAPPAPPTADRQQNPGFVPVVAPGWQ